MILSSPLSTRWSKALSVLLGLKGPNTVKTATKPSQPIEKSTAGASLLAQVIVAKTADHLPLHRQEKIFQRHGVDISRKTMGGWLAQCGELLQPLYGSLKEALFQSKVIGTDDTSVKVLDAKLPFAPHRTHLAVLR